MKTKNQITAQDLKELNEGFTNPPKIVLIQALGNYESPAAARRKAQRFAHKSPLTQTPTPVK